MAGTTASAGTRQGRIFSRFTEDLIPTPGWISTPLPNPAPSEAPSEEGTGDDNGESGRRYVVEQSLASYRDHGTHVARLASLGNPKIGLVLVKTLIPSVVSMEEFRAYQAHATLPTSLLDGQVTHRQQFVEALKFYRYHPVRVVNLSLGLGLKELAQTAGTRRGGMERSLRELQETTRILGTESLRDPEVAKTLLVIAAGNDGFKLEKDWQGIPGNLLNSNILSVGA